MASNTDTKVNNAENVAAWDRELNVRGSEQTHEVMAVTTLNTIVHLEWPVMVLRYSAPTKQCKPWK